MPRGKAKLSPEAAKAIKEKQTAIIKELKTQELDTKFMVFSELLDDLKELEGYQRKKLVAAIYQGCDAGLKSMLMDELIDHWATQLPKKAKEFGIDESSKVAAKINWLEEHWGTAFQSSKGTPALRKMPTEQVIELLITFILSGCAPGEDDLTFGSLDNGSPLAEKVASALDTMKDSVGEEVVITRAAYNELQRLRTMMKEMSPDALRQVDTRLVDTLQTVLKSVPAAKTQAEIDAAEAKKKG